MVLGILLWVGGLPIFVQKSSGLKVFDKALPMWDFAHGNPAFYREHIYCHFFTSIYC
jgi:hypothetical protein